MSNRPRSRPLPAVLVTVNSGYDNVAPTTWVSYVQSTSVMGNHYVPDRWGYHMMVSAACVRPLGIDASFEVVDGRLVATVERTVTTPAGDTTPVILTVASVTDGVVRVYGPQAGPSVTWVLA